ncbi:MAG: hypothetical protein ACRDD1_12550, partial [Planctomycetia bacterium]
MSGWLKFFGVGSPAMAILMLLSMLGYQVPHPDQMANATTWEWCAAAVQTLANIRATGGVPTPGRPTTDYPAPGYQAPGGYPTAGVPTPGRPTSGYPAPGYSTPAYPTGGYPAPGYAGEPPRGAFSPRGTP